MTDVPQRSLQDEFALRESRMRTLFESIDEGYCICEMILDADGRPIDYRFLEVNPLFEEMTGLRSATGKTAYELVPSLEREWIDKYAQVALHGETLRFEQGSEAMGRWFEVFATPVEPIGQFAVVFKDQTARKKWETSLTASEERFRSMTERLPLLVWQHDAQGRQEWVNETFCTYFGVTREEMVDHRWQMLVHPDDSETNTWALTEAVIERTDFHSIVRVKRADGSWRWLESWAHPTFDGAGNYLGHLGTSADVTERVHHAEGLDIRASQSALMAELLTDLVPRPSTQERLQRLVDLLVIHVADYAVVEAPFEASPLLAAAHKDPAE